MNWNKDVHTHPVGSRVKRNEKLQCDLLELIDEKPGLTGEQLAQLVGVEQNKVYCLLKQHRSDGSIIIDRGGRSLKGNNQKAFRYYSNPQLKEITSHLSIGAVRLGLQNK